MIIRVLLVNIYFGCKYNNYLRTFIYMAVYNYEKLTIGAGGRSLIRFRLKDINTPGRARIPQVSSRRDILRYLNAFLLCVSFLNCI